MLVLKIPEKQINLVEPFLPNEIVRIVKNPLKVCLVLGIFLHGAPIGALACEVKGEQAVLLSIYVKKEERRMGCGSMLIEKLISILLHFQEISSLSLDFAHTGSLIMLKPFLEKKEFLMERYDCLSYQVRLADAVDIFSRKKYRAAGLNAAVLPLLEVPKDKRNSLERKIHKQSQWFEEVSFTEAEDIGEFSLGYLKEERLEGVLLVGNVLSHSLDLEYFYMNKELAASAIPLLSRLVSTLQNTFPGDTIVTIPTMNEQAEKLIQHIFTEAFKAERYFYHAETYLVGRNQENGI